MSEKFVSELINDLRPLEFLYLMNYVGKEEMNVKERLTALLGYLGHVGMIIKSESGYELSGKNRDSLDLRIYERKALDHIDRGEIYFLGNLLLDTNFVKFLIKADILKNWIIFYKKTDKFCRCVKAISDLRETIKRFNENKTPLKSELKPYFYAFPSIVPEDDDYAVWAKVLAEEHLKIFRECIVWYPYH